MSSNNSERSIVASSVDVIFVICLALWWELLHESICCRFIIPGRGVAFKADHIDIEVVWSTCQGHLGITWLDGCWLWPADTINSCEYSDDKFKQAISAKQIQQSLPLGQRSKGPYTKRIMSLLSKSNHKNMIASQPHTSGITPETRRGCRMKPHGHVSLLR